MFKGKGSALLKIEFENTRVVMLPETPDETAKLEALWRVMVDCNGFNKKLVPIGEFLPGINKDGASFAIEGLDPAEEKYTEVKIRLDGQYYCKTCNKVVKLKEGQSIPICCGKMMEYID